MSDLPTKEELVEAGARAWHALKQERNILIRDLVPFELAVSRDDAVVAAILDAVLPLVMRGPAEEIRRLTLAYVNLLEIGRDRIIALGGDCDPVDVMEAGDPALHRARTVRQWAEKIGGG